MKIHSRESNKQAFFSMEFVSIFTSDEGKAFKKNVTSLLLFSSHSELITGVLVTFP